MVVPSSPSARFILAALLGLFTLTACAPSDPLDELIDARTDLTYSQWSYRVIDQLPPRARQEFRDAQREILLTIQMKYAGLPPVEQRVMQRRLIHGRSAREVIIEGHQLRLTRLRAADADDTALLAVNAERILADNVSPSAAAYLAERLGPIKERQATRQREIAAIEQRLAELGGDASARPSLESPAAPAADERPRPPPDPRKTI